MLILDEVLNHLDGPGRARVGRLLKAMCRCGPCICARGYEYTRGHIALRARLSCPLNHPHGRSDGASGDGDASTRGEELPSSGLSTIIVILQDLVAYEMEVGLPMHRKSTLHVLPPLCTRRLEAV